MLNIFPLFLFFLLETEPGDCAQEQVGGPCGPAHVLHVVPAVQPQHRLPRDGEGGGLFFFVGGGRGFLRPLGLRQVELPQGGEAGAGGQRIKELEMHRVGMERVKRALCTGLWTLLSKSVHNYITKFFVSKVVEYGTFQITFLET